MVKYLTIMEILAFVASLIAIPVLRERRYLLMFPVLLLPIVVVEGYEAFISDKGTPTAFIYNFQIPVVQLCYLIMLAWSMKEKTRRHVLLWASAIFIFFTVFTMIFYFEGTKFNVLSYSLGSILLVASILLKFYEMLKSPVHFDFLKAPFFYMLFAFFLFNMGTLPYFTMANWLYYSVGSHDLVKVLYNVMMVLNVLLYTTYTVCFLWMKAKKDSY